MGEEDCRNGNEKKKNKLDRTCLEGARTNDLRCG